MFVSMLFHDTTYSDFFLSDSNVEQMSSHVQSQKNLMCLNSMNVGKYLVTVITCAVSVNSIHKIVCGLNFFTTQISNAAHCCKISDKFM